MSSIEELKEENSTEYSSVNSVSPKIWKMRPMHGLIVSVNECMNQESNDQSGEGGVAHI
jgi:predicted secreted protein